VRLRAKDRGSRDDDLLTNSYQQVGIATEGIGEEIKVLNDKPLLGRKGPVDEVDDLIHLGECELKPHIQVKGGRRVQVGKSAAELHNLPREDRIVIIGELQPGKHPMDEGGLAGAGSADDADQTIGEAEMQLADPLAKL